MISGLCAAPASAARTALERRTCHSRAQDSPACPTKAGQLNRPGLSRFLRWFSLGFSCAIRVASSAMVENSSSSARKGILTFKPLLKGWLTRRRREGVGSISKKRRVLTYLRFNAEQWLNNSFSLAQGAAAHGRLPLRSVIEYRVSSGSYSVVAIS